MTKAQRVISAEMTRWLLYSSRLVQCKNGRIPRNSIGKGADGDVPRFYDAEGAEGGRQGIRA